METTEAEEPKVETTPAPKREGVACAPHDAAATVFVTADRDVAIVGIGSVYANPYVHASIHLTRAQLAEFGVAVRAALALMPEPVPEPVPA